MTLFQQIFQTLRPLLPLLAVVALVTATLFAVRRLLERRYHKAPERKFHSQALMLVLTLAGALAVLVALPVSESLRVQILRLIGILLSAAVALSSTTFLGNAMAGVLLRVVRNFRLGDFIRVDEHFGRVSERGLFHTEIQTENRDLTTLPNLYLITHPVKVVRTSGTIISATVSLGYDVPRKGVRDSLLRAAEVTGLDEPFVQITELGDFSVTYRVAGLLKEVRQLISMQSKLRASVLDELHRDGIEIVSPTFMNTRALEAGVRFLPPETAEPESVPEPETLGLEELLFEKAEEAESVEDLDQRIGAIDRALAKLDELLEKAEEAVQADLERCKADLQGHRERLQTQLERAREKHRASG
jgi:small-conductance mechanosensitive channel